MTVFNAECRASGAWTNPEPIPNYSTYGIWGLDDSSFQTLMTLGQVKASELDSPFHAISPGVSFSQQCVYPSRGAPLQCADVPTSFDYVTFDNICAEDEWWTWQDGDAYTLSTNYGPGTGAALEYNNDTDDEDHLAIYQALDSIHADRWNGETVYYMGAMRWVVDAAAYPGLPAAAGAVTADDAKARITALTGEVAALKEKLSTYKTNVKAFQTDIATTEQQIKDREAQLAQAKQDLKQAESAGDPRAAVQYLDEVRNYFATHYADPQSKMEDGVEVLFSGIAPVSVNDPMFGSAMLAIAKADPSQAEFVQLLIMIHNYNTAVDLLARAEAPPAAPAPTAEGQSPPPTPEVLLQNAKAWLDENDKFKIALQKLDPRQQALVSMLALRTMVLEMRIKALEARLTPCESGQIRLASGECQPCDDGLVPNAAQNACEATDESCGYSDLVPAADGLSCQPCGEGTVFKDAETGCVDKPKPAARLPRRVAPSRAAPAHVDHPEPAAPLPAAPKEINPWEM